MTNNDYEKAEKRSYKEYQTSELRKAVAEPNEWLAHKAGFMDGYELGRAHTQPANKLENERLQVAAMAMQGLLSNEHGFQFNNKDVAKTPENVAEAAVMFADALLIELNKENNDTDSN